MKQYITIKNGKIYDICSNLVNKRDVKILDKDYFLTEEKDIVWADHWDFENNCSLKDSPQRFIEPEPSEIELLKERTFKLEETQLQLINKMLELEKRK